MNLRPLTEELLSNCVREDFCTDCKYRVGCPIRFSFYDKKLDSELHFEIQLQLLEIKAAKIFGVDDALMGANHLRNKVVLERKNNPTYSYL